MLLTNDNKNISFLIDHVFQFILTMSVLILYYLTYSSGHPSSVLESSLTLVVAFWFYSYTSLRQASNTNNKLDDNSIKIQKLSDKIDTQETKKV